MTIEQALIAVARPLNAPRERALFTPRDTTGVRHLVSIKRCSKEQTHAMEQSHPIEIIFIVTPLLPHTTSRVQLESTLCPTSSPKPLQLARSIHSTHWIRSSELSQADVNDNQSCYVSTPVNSHCHGTLSSNRVPSSMSSFLCCLLDSKGTRAHEITRSNIFGPSSVVVLHTLVDLAPLPLAMIFNFVLYPKFSLTVPCQKKRQLHGGSIVKT